MHAHLFALPLLTLLAAREKGGVGTPSKWALLAGLLAGLTPAAQAQPAPPPAPDGSLQIVAPQG